MQSFYAAPAINIQWYSKKWYIDLLLNELVSIKNYLGLITVKKCPCFIHLKLKSHIFFPAKCYTHIFIAKNVCLYHTVTGI